MTQTARHRGLIGPFEVFLARLKSGEAASWNQLFEDLSGPVRGYLAGRGAVSEADDLAAEVFLQIARDIHRFEGDDSDFRSWVFVIAHRRLIDWRRKEARRPSVQPLRGEDHSGGDVEEEAIGRLASDRMVVLLNDLTPEQREVLSLRLIADLSLEETARVLRKRIGAVKALQRRGILALRRGLEDEEVSQ